MITNSKNEILEYCEKNSSNPSIFLELLTAFTWKNTTNPRQLSGHIQGKLLSLIVRLMKPKMVLEIGTFTGYSTASLLEYLPIESEIHTIEADKEIFFKTQEFWKLNDTSKRINFHYGIALDIIPTLKIKSDLIFIDADKRNYINYFDLCLPLLQENGVMIFDNTLWSGKVAQKKERESNTDTRIMHEFNVYIKNNEFCEVLLLPIRDGLTILTKKI
jgi:predicted O-methyltransferase YrrM